MNETNRKYAYVAVRMLELLFASAFVFGIMWQGAESFMLSVPQFLMLYGGLGALVCELAARSLRSPQFIEKRRRTK